MRNFIILAWLLSFFFRGASAFALEIDFGTLGYGRIGQGSSSGESKVCFKAPGAGAKYRLGNECEVWIEVGAHATFRRDKGKNSPFLRAEAMISFFEPNEKSVDYRRLEQGLID